MNNDAPLKVIINGQEEELSPEDAANLITKARSVDELEKKYNTSFDKVWPDYNRSQQEKSQLAKELDEARENLKKFESDPKEGKETDQDVQNAIEAARKLGIPLREDLEKEGWLKQEDVEKLFEEREANKRATDQILAEAEKLERDINGSDGRPEFNKKAVLAYASNYRREDGEPFANLTEAYEDMNRTRIEAWKTAQVEAEKAKSLRTLGKTAKKEPTAPRVTNDNLGDMIKESLYSSE